jgi:hydroxymethylglutaryl-CoA lyase
LRDGIQGADPANYNTNKKKKIFEDIRTKYNPAKMEIGSFVSPKVLPIMQDTADIFNFAKTVEKRECEPEIYALVPNKKGLMDAIQTGFRNFSFITSVSNGFQIKNTRRNLDYKKSELCEMMDILNPENKTKLYISCINECPISGLIDSDFVIHEILSSYGLREFDGGAKTFDEICLSDTMGTLRSKDFEYILDGLLRFGLAKNRISLHLHVASDNASEAKRILFACFQKGITRFDVSTILEGGCSVSMDRTHLKPNMTYEFFFAALEEFEQNN